MKFDLESNGWRQGSVAQSSDVTFLVDGTNLTLPTECELVVISQSCDLVQHPSVEPFVEAIVAEIIAKPDGNYTHNKNGRTLDLPLKVSSIGSVVSDERYLRLRAIKKIAIPKSRFAELKPSVRKVIPTQSVTVLTEWLAARYNRAAFPNDFNAAITNIDPSQKKLKRIAKRLSPHTAGLYFEIVPNRDLMSGEKYRVNLLGMIIPSAAKHRPKVEKDVDELRRLLETAGMDVQQSVQTEEEVSVAVRKRMRRMHLNDISHKADHPLPSED